MTRAGATFTLRAVLALAPLLLAGCVGFSRQESGELFPADSLSRRLAEGMPRDTLELVRHIDDLTVGDSTWQYIASIRYQPDGHLVATDLGRALSYVFGPDGEFGGALRHPGVRYPYLLQAAHDTVVVHDAGEGQVVWFAGSRAYRRIEIPKSTSRSALTVFAALAPSGLFVKRTTDPGPATLSRYDPLSGSLLASWTLGGPTWQYRGPMIARGDTLLSVSAFQPLVHRIGPAGPVDTLRLVGFDSPALNRTRAFVLGTRKDPPLLVPAIAAADTLLYVLNVRPDHVRVDVYDRSGHLTRILEEASVDEAGVNAIDLAVHRSADGTVRLAVARASAEYGAFSLRYKPSLSLYRWRPSPGAGRNENPPPA